MYELENYNNDLIKEYKPKDIYLESFSCPFYLIDHHYAHALSIWPVADKTDIDFVLDGMGDFEKSYSIFSKNKLLKSYEVDEAESIGRCLAALGLGGTEFASANEVLNAIHQQNNPVVEKISDEDLEVIKGQLILSHEAGELKQAFHKLSPYAQEKLRDFANDLRKAA